MRFVHQDIWKNINIIKKHWIFHISSFYYFTALQYFVRPNLIFETKKKKLYFPLYFNLIRFLWNRNTDLIEVLQNLSIIS